MGRAPHNRALASTVQQQCLRRGLILEVGARHSSVLRLLPPLIITAAQVAEIFASALDAAVSH